MLGIMDDLAAMEDAHELQSDVRAVLLDHCRCAAAARAYVTVEMPNDARPTPRWRIVAGGVSIALLLGLLLVSRHGGHVFAVVTAALFVVCIVAAAVLYHYYGASPRRSAPRRRTRGPRPARR